MAPLPVTPNIPDLALSSLELDSRSSFSNDLPISFTPSNTNSFAERNASPIAAAPTTTLSNSFDQGITTSASTSTSHPTSSTTSISHSTITYNPTAGSVDPSAINMKGIQAIFSLIGVSFVLGIIWFFFWAKNGGFHWRKGDWEDYKSTVLRRKGPNGTTLSNGTKSTRLGGGSVVGQGYSDRDDGTVFTGTMTELSIDTASIMKEKRKANKKQKGGGKGVTAKERKMREQKAAKYEGAHDNDLRAYMHEKPAQVGGMNTQSDSQYYGTEYTASAPSVANHDDEHAAPPPPPQHKPKSRTASPEKKERQTRRDFSYSQEDSFNASGMPQSQSPRPGRYHSPAKHAAGPRAGRQSASYAAPADFSDVQSQNTRSYHHPIPGLSGAPKVPGGYRWDRRDSLDD